jgi:hypothetical protein
MKKLFYVFAVALIGLVAACGNANNSSTSEEVSVEEVANDAATKDAKCCGGTKEDCASKTDGDKKCCGGTKEDCASKNEGVEHSHDHDHDHDDEEHSHDHDHDHDNGDDEEHSHDH